MQVGDKIIWTNEGFTNPQAIRSGTVTYIKGDLCWIDNQHKPEDCIYVSFCWPAAVREKLEEICRQRGALKKAFDDSMGLIYKLRNQIVRGEI